MNESEARMKVKPMVRIYTFRVTGSVIFVVQGSKKALDIAAQLFDKYKK